MATKKADIQRQEIVISDFSLGIFSHRVFASSLQTQDGAAAEFINSTNSPIPTDDFTRDTREPGVDVDVSNRIYTYGCVGNENGLSPLPRRVHRRLDKSDEIQSDPTRWGPFDTPREVVVATALLSPVWHPYDAPSDNTDEPDLNGGVTRVKFPDQLHVLTCRFVDPRNSGSGTFQPIPHYRWSTFTNQSKDDPSWEKFDLISTGIDPDPYITVGANSYARRLRNAQWFGTGGLAIGLARRHNDTGTLHTTVMGVFGDLQSTFLDVAGVLDGQDGTVDQPKGAYVYPAFRNRAVQRVKNDPTTVPGNSFYSAYDTVMYHQNRFIIMVSKGNMEELRRNQLANPGDANYISPLSVLGSDQYFIYNNDYNWYMELEVDGEARTRITDSTGGISIWGSMNANELFLVKNTGGAIAFRGDIAAPQQVNLPSVASAYGAGALGAATPLGLVYGTRDGVHIWTGGDSSEHVSSQLGQRWFWNGITCINDYKTPTLPKGKFAFRYPFVYVSTNWLFDIRNKSWWRLAEPSTSLEYVNYEVSNNGNIYAINSHVTRENQVLFDIYSPDELTSEYRWISQPLARTKDKVQNYRTVNVTATGKSDITVTLIGIDGERETLEFPAGKFSNIRPTTVSEQCHLHAEDVTLVVEVSSVDPDAPAAVIQRITLGFDNIRSVERA